MRTITLTAVMCSVILSIAGCSSKSNPSSPKADASAGDDTGDDAAAPPGSSKDQGNIVSYDDGKTPLRGATVAAGSVTTTTDDKGNFTLDAPSNTPVSLIISLDQYATTYMPETILGGDYTWPKIFVPSTSTFHLAQGALPNFDASKGVVYLVAYALPPCQTIAGATVTVESPPDAAIVYFHGALTSQSQLQFEDHVPGAALYNVPPGADVKVTLHHPSCTQKAFPVTVDNATFTGKVDVHAASEDANSALDLFLE